MKTKKYNWGDREFETYSPKVNRKRQGLLISVIGLTTLLPGPNVLGLGITKLISKVNPLYVYN